MKDEMAIKCSVKSGKRIHLVLKHCSSMSLYVAVIEIKGKKSVKIWCKKALLSSRLRDLLPSDSFHEPLRVSLVSMKSGKEILIDISIDFTLTNNQTLSLPSVTRCSNR